MQKKKYSIVQIALKTSRRAPLKAIATARERGAGKNNQPMEQQEFSSKAGNKA